MVFCGICKQNKDTINKWVIHEHSIDNNIMRDFKICDSCAGSLLRTLSVDKDEDIPKGTRLNLTRNTLIHELILGEDDNLEIVLSMDLAKARKLVLDQTSQK